MIRLVVVTAPAASAEPLARKLLLERLVACVNFVRGVRSLYWWNGKLDKARETLLVFKTAARNIPRLLARIRALHPYDVPEILVLEVEVANPPYVKWVLREARPKKNPKNKKKRHHNINAVI